MASARRPLLGPPPRLLPPILTLPLIALLAAGAARGEAREAAPVAPGREAPATELQRGIALGLFAEDPGFSYRPLLEEIAAAGATHVSVVVPYYMHDVRSVRITAHPRFSPTAETVERTLKQARRAGLKVLLFPILRLEYEVTPQEWRGTLRPRDPEAWWRGYSELMLGLARLAARHRVEALCIGSELGSLDEDPAPWAPLIAQVRRLYKGQLIYSANWDHYDKVRLWHLVDQAGLSAYFQLTDPSERPSLHRLTHSWREQRVQIERWRVRTGKPLVFTELGYHSQQGTSAFPWDESADRAPSQQEQADCLRAFLRVWRGAPGFSGVYFWNWFGYGGPGSREYCPRGKQAAGVICRWFKGAAGACPAAWGMPWHQE